MSMSSPWRCGWANAGDMLLAAMIAAMKCNAVLVIMVSPVQFFAELLRGASVATRREGSGC
jgi:hypothetical protein